MLNLPSPKTPRGSTARMLLSPRAFTLIELLAVIAIMVTLMAALAPSFLNANNAGNLNGGGTLLVNMANNARQNALAKNTMTALVMVTDPSVDSRNRLLTMLELRPPSSGHASSPSDWKQISKWEVLAQGVIINNWAAQSTMSGTVYPSLPSLTYSSKTISEFKSLIFMPDGSTYDNSPTTVELVEGYYPDGASAPVLTRLSKSGGIVNSFQLTVLNATGRIKIDRDRL